MSAIFRSDLQERVLRAIWADPVPRTATALAGSLGAPVSTVSRETTRLVTDGLLLAKPDGRRLLLTPNWRNPFMRGIAVAFQFEQDLQHSTAAGWHTSTSRIAASIADELRAGDQAMALRVLLDGVNRIPLANAAGLLAQLLDEPDTTGDTRWDTLLATAVRYHCRKLGVEAPHWTRKPPLPSWWWPAGEHARAAITVQRTPVDFRRLGIWFDERNFNTA